MKRLCDDPRCVPKHHGGLHWKFRPGEGLGSVHHAKAVFTAKLICPAEFAFRIVAPLAVHQQAVFVMARKQRDGGFPQTAFEFLQKNRRLLPPSEIPRELNGLRFGSDAGEGHFLFCDCLLCHECLFIVRNRFSPAGLKLLPQTPAVKLEVGQINHWHFAPDRDTNTVRFISERKN
jgi:hypothetical protein